MSYCRWCLQSMVMCFIRVHGIFISVDTTADAKECAKKCHARRACKWFTYDSGDQSCLLTKDKQYMSNCPTCRYGHGHCIQKGTSGMTTFFLWKIHMGLIWAHHALCTAIAELKLEIGQTHTHPYNPHDLYNIPHWFFYLLHKWSQEASKPSMCISVTLYSSVWQKQDFSHFGCTKMANIWSQLIFGWNWTVLGWKRLI